MIFAILSGPNASQKNNTLTSLVFIALDFFSLAGIKMLPFAATVNRKTVFLARKGMKKCLDVQDL